MPAHHCLLRRSAQSEAAPGDASDDEGAVDDEEAEPASDENTPTMVAGAASSIDH
jgi:hypothetical protein